MPTSTIIQDGIREELSKLHCKDKGRRLFLFLMLNGRRHRKLGKHFENIDLHRLEFQLPFFDGSFFAAILAFPMDDCLRHRLYLRWMSLFPPAVTKCSVAGISRARTVSDTNPCGSHLSVGRRISDG